jgi:hypothetical protein
MIATRTVWGHIQSGDHRLMRKVHRWRAPRWFRILTVSMTRLGDGWLWYSLGLILAVGHLSRGRGHCSLPHLETRQPPQTPVRDRTSLLVAGFAAG